MCNTVWTLGYGAVWPTLGEIDIVVSLTPFRLPVVIRPMDTDSERS